jgi:hypothetical protein
MNDPVVGTPTIPDSDLVVSMGCLLWVQGSPCLLARTDGRALPGGPHFQHPGAMRVFDRTRSGAKITIAQAARQGDAELEIWRLGP